MDGEHSKIESTGYDDQAEDTSEEMFEPQPLELRHTLAV